MKQQQGFGALLLLILIAVVSISVALVASDRKRSAQAAEQVIQHAALQVQRIQEAALVYHSGWGVWPDNSDVLDQHDLVALTDLNTTFDSVMELSVEADEETQRFIISLDTHTDNQANTLANLVLNGQAVGNRVISSMPSPYDVTSYDDFLRRAESTAMPDGNTMEVDLDVAGYNLENVRDAQGQRLQANRLAADDMNSDDIQVDGYMDIGSARLQSTGSTLNVSSGFTTTGNMSAQLANLATVTTTGNVSGTNFTGDNFTASDVGANENQIYQELMQLQQDLDECMYEGDRPCMPQAPVISNVSCPSCDLSGERSNFSATMSATVSNCRQGCSFSWAISNTLSGTCSAGTVTASQGSRNLSCTVSGTLEPQESLTGNVTLTARNSRNSSLATNTARNVSWTNTTDPRTPLDDIVFAVFYYNTGGNYGPSNSGDVVIPLLNGKPISEWGNDCSGCVVSYEPLQDMDYFVADEPWRWTLRGVFSSEISGFGGAGGETFTKPINLQSSDTIGLSVSPGGRWGQYPSQDERQGDRVIRFTVTEGNEAKVTDVTMYARYQLNCQQDEWSAC